MASDIHLRPELPKDLRFLLARYPREIWPAHGNLGAVARFWLERHAMFRELGAMLEQGLVDFRAEKLQGDMFQSWFAPRLQFMLSQLNHHHQIEDHHYFPLFRAAETRLVPGFDLLEGDHAAIHRLIIETAETANIFLRALASDPDARRRAGDGYAVVSGQLLHGLVRHLDDEEDLIVPLILERGEAALGMDF